MKVIASQLRKGNIVELDNRLYVVLKAENFHPGKGTPTTSVDMRRISDGVKVAERWRTTEMVEKAQVDEREYDFLYEDGEGFHFMEPLSYDQITVSEDVVGESKVFLGEGVKAYVQTYDGVAIAITLPVKAVVEIAETEPVTKGQTASSSYKPAICTNGLRVLVPPHIGPGTRIIINTEDGVISSNAAKELIFPRMWTENLAAMRDPAAAMAGVRTPPGQRVAALISATGAEQISDAGAIEKIVYEVLGANAQQVADFKAGKEKAFNSLVGQVMKATRGKANPAQVNDLLRKKLQD